MIRKSLSGIEALSKEEDIFHPGFSIDCVILGFNNGILKILLTNYKGFDFWMLPGSFIFKDEDVDDAALRILYERTGLEEIFLRQFYLFGNKNRMRGNDNETSYKQRIDFAEKIYKEVYNINITESHWFRKRFITAGYYALVDFTNVALSPSNDYERLEWKDINSETTFYADHRSIIEKALETIRAQLSVLPIGRELLPDKFTMSELRILYETILGRNLDRRNFQRKIISLGYIDKLDEKRKGGAHKAPALFCFNEEKYNEAQEKGLGVSW